MVADQLERLLHSITGWPPFNRKEARDEICVHTFFATHIAVGGTADFPGRGFFFMLSMKSLAARCVE